MKNHFKRLLSLMLVVIMLVPMISATGLTVTAATYSGTCGYNLTWSFNDTTGVLKIEGTGDMYNYSYESYNSSYRTTAPWKTYISYIKSVVISDSVTSIGNRAFSDCTSLTSVTIGNSVTSIGDIVFADCTSLTSVTIPDSVTSIGSSAFSSCTSLTSVTIPDSVTSIDDSAFYNCTSLTSVTIPDSVTSIGKYAFDNCYALTSVTIPDSVTSIGSSAFAHCDSLTSVTIGNSVTSIGDYAFEYCDSLTSVTIGNSVTSIGIVAFGYCRSLTSVTIPDSVTSIDDSAFYNCTSLTSVTIPDSVTSIGSDAFDNTAYYNNSSNWTNNVLYIGNHLIKAKDSISGAYSIKDGTLTIAGFAFEDCTSLTSVTIPDSVTSIGKYAFDNCYSLTSVTIPDSVTSISYGAFQYCYSLTSVTIPDSVTSIVYQAFYYCYSITSVYITDIAAWCGITFNGYYANPLCYAKNLYLNNELITDLVIPDSVTSIGNFAFYDCRSLTSVTIPDSVTSIGDGAFHYFSNGSYYKLDLTIKCYENAYAHTYAKNNGFKYELMCRHSFTNYISDNNATCTGDGTKTAYCDNGCGATDIITDEGTALGHTWSEWIVSIEPTYTTEGEQIRFCYVCDTVENEVIPAVTKPEAPVITVDNFTVTITDAENIKDMRYAPGEYTTTTEIRNAEGNVALDNGVVTANTVDGNFVYEMPDGGYYTFWVRMSDGREYLLAADMTKFTPTVDIYGVKITVDGLYDVKDCFIAKGEFDNYNEIKNNGYIVRLTSNKIAGKHNYTYTVSDPGMHTILVRYNDGSEYIFHEELTVDEPVFTTNGLQVTISNIPDVKVIRTAYGEYYTPGDTKRAEGARNFSNKAVIKDAESYMLQYREEGRVTIIVEYNNGYVKVFHYDVTKKVPTMEQDGNTVTFGELDGLVMVRYAMGEYATSSEIKKASGSKVIKPDAIVDGKISVTLEPGTYTFCVQFDDESYNYYKVVIE